MRVLWLFALPALAVLEAPAQARACTFPEEPEVRFFRFEAPVGGLWWVHGLDTRFSTETFPLVDTTGTEVLVDIVSVGASGAAALRVPDVPVGTRFVYPDTLQRQSDSVFDEELVVVAGTVTDIAEPPSPPVIRVEEREVMVGYEGVLTSPIGGECVAAGAPGLWNIHYDERPFLVVDDPGADVVLDVQLQTPEEAPFDEVESANEILFDARIAAPVDEHLSEPPETVDVFSVHARVRRIADGAVSETVSLDVTRDDVPAEERLELVGCSCAGASPVAASPVFLGLLALRALRSSHAAKRRTAARRPPQDLRAHDGRPTRSA